MSATTQPSRRNPSMSDGFARLTLNPAQKLGKARESLAHQNPVREGWSQVAAAMTEATRSIGRTVTAMTDRSN